MGASLGDRIAGIGIASGTVGFTLPNGQVANNSAARTSIPVIAFHGKKDTHIHYDGGGLRANDLSVADLIKFPSASCVSCGVELQLSALSKTLIESATDRSFARKPPPS